MIGKCQSFCALNPPIRAGWMMFQKIDIYLVHGTNWKKKGFGVEYGNTFVEKTIFPILGVILFMILRINPIWLLALIKIRLKPTRTRVFIVDDY